MFPFRCVYLKIIVPFQHFIVAFNSPFDLIFFLQYLLEVASQSKDYTSTLLPHTRYKSQIVEIKKSYTRF